MPDEHREVVSVVPLWCRIRGKWDLRSSDSGGQKSQFYTHLQQFVEFYCACIAANRNARQLAESERVEHDCCKLEFGERQVVLCRVTTAGK